MRFLSLPSLIVLLSCSGSSADPDGAVNPDPDADSSLHCGASLDTYCAQTTCVRSTAGLSRCAYFTCADYNVYLGSTSPGPGPFEFNYYDRMTGQLVAVVRGVCLGGPASFNAPDLGSCAQAGGCVDAGP